MENKWELLESSNEDREKIWTKNRTFAGDVWFRFRHKPTAIAGLVLILVLLGFAFIGPFFTHYSYSKQDLDLVKISSALVLGLVNLPVDLIGCSQLLMCAKAIDPSVIHHQDMVRMLYA